MNNIATETYVSSLYQMQGREIKLRLYVGCMSGWDDVAAQRSQETGEGIMLLKTQMGTVLARPSAVQREADYKQHHSRKLNGGAVRTGRKTKRDRRFSDTVASVFRMS
jgi:hypothetical protein